MQEVRGVPAMSDVKEAHQPSKRTSGIAGMFPFLQRPSMDTGGHHSTCGQRQMFFRIIWQTSKVSAALHPWTTSKFFEDIQHSRWLLGTD